MNNAKKTLKKINYIEKPIYSKFILKKALKN